MNAMDANRNSPGYELTDELARYCLPPANRDPNRKLAWVNSICLLFLIICVAGAKSVSIALQPPPPLPAESVPVLIEPPPPPAAADQQKQEQTIQEKPDAPRVVVAVPDSPAILFSVPTIANVLAVSGSPTTPPINPMQPVEALQNQPETIKPSGFERPKPPYPDFLRSIGGEQSVPLLITVDRSGNITGLKVTQSSGIPELDQYVSNYVKARWIISSKEGTNLQYQTTIHFVLKR
jgi:TonB family protein